MLQLKSVRVCGPRYWPQLIELSPNGMIDTRAFSLFRLPNFTLPT